MVYCSAGGTGNAERRVCIEQPGAARRALWPVCAGGGTARKGVGSETEKRGYEHKSAEKREPGPDAGAGLHCGGRAAHGEYPVYAFLQSAVQRLQFCGAGVFHDQRIYVAQPQKASQRLCSGQNRRRDAPGGCMAVGDVAGQRGGGPDRAGGSRFSAFRTCPPRLASTLSSAAISGSSGISGRRCFSTPACRFCTGCGKRAGLGACGSAWPLRARR